MTALKLPGALVSVNWLADHLSNPKLIVLDASMKTPIHAADFQFNANWKELQIPGARLFDFDERICDPSSSLPHMMPNEEIFTREVQALGVRKDSVIVVYDNCGVYSSPRAWWMLKAMGHEHVAVLDGGLPTWIKANLPCEEKSKHIPQILAGDFAAKPNTSNFCNAEHVINALYDKNYVILDGRSEGRFLGQKPEPRSGLRAGHMPNARSLPFEVVLEKGHMKTIKELQGIFAGKANARQKLIFSCGSGVTSCVLALAAHLADYPKITVYDGSWSEWGLISSSRPVVTTQEKYDDGGSI